MEVKLRKKTNNIMADTQTDENLEKKENKVLVREDGIVYIEIAKEPLLAEDIWEALEEAKKILEGLPGKARILINIKIFSIIHSSQFRKKTSEIIKDILKTTGYEKIALMGGNTFIKTVASFLLAASGIKNAKIFNTEKEALNWLKQCPNPIQKN